MRASSPKCANCSTNMALGPSPPANLACPSPRRPDRPSGQFAIKAIAAARGRELPALAEIPGSASRRSAASPASIPRAGPGRGGTSPSRGPRSKRSCARLAQSRRFGAHFMCLLTLAFPDGEIRELRGPGRWRTGRSRRAGSLVFGYDPIFLPEDLDKTFGEMTLEEKRPFRPTDRPPCRIARARFRPLRGPASPLRRNVSRPAPPACGGETNDSRETIPPKT